MEASMIVVFLLSLMAATGSAAEWYEQGSVPVLGPANFSEVLTETHKYKFVKFFTHSCRYCRMLKQVEDQLI